MNAPETVEARRPGRPKREKVTQTERRRRTGGTIDKLEIPQSVIKAHPDMEFRWARDEAGRMQQLTVHDDWDRVPSIEPIHGGKGEDGRGMKMHLLMKPKAFMEADRREKAARNIQIVKERETQHPDAKTATETGAEMYSVPGNKLT
jgi:hypothetical protein